MGFLSSMQLKSRKETARIAARDERKQNCPATDSEPETRIRYSCLEERLGEKREIHGQHISIPTQLVGAGMIGVTQLLHHDHGFIADRLTVLY